MRYYTILLTGFLLISCDNKTATNQKNTSVIQNISKADSISTIDTTIILKGIVKSNFNKKKLTDSIAKETLYAYFKSKGYYNSDNLPGLDSVSEADLSVDFNKIYLIDLNGAESQDAVITYWLTPPYASGNCWQPHKAIILNTDGGYKITNEEFIPDYFAIDSISNIEGQVTVYSYNYDCENQKIVKYIRARIKLPANNK